MRLVHLADLHLGFRQYQRLTPTGINQRETDVATAFRRAIDRVIELRPDIVVIAGDVFHTVRPMNPAIIHAFQQFARLRLAVPDAIVVMVAGNHDRPRTNEMSCILGLFKELGIHVAIHEPKRFSFPEQGVSILAVPDIEEDLPALEPEPGVPQNILLLHGEVEGMIPEHIARMDRHVRVIPRETLNLPRWNYVALGHYHVHQEIAPNAYYSGSIEYTSPNPWGELVEERETSLAGKGFVEYDLEAGAARFHRIDGVRAFVNLPAVNGAGRSAAEIDAAIRERVDGCPGGIEDKVVRLVARDVPRHVQRELDQKALREYRKRALHFQFDARRPELQKRDSASGSPGRRPTLSETVEHYFAKRPLAPGVDRAALIALGLRYLGDADAAASAMAAPADDGARA